MHTVVIMGSTAEATSTADIMLPAARRAAAA
jgi:hypothetical protein